MTIRLETRTGFGPLVRWVVATLALTVGAMACSIDDEPPGKSDNPKDDDSKRTDGGQGGGGLRDDSGVAKDAASAEDDDALWVVGGWLSTPDSWTGYLTVVDDLSADGSVDPSKAVEFAGDMNYTSPGNGQVYVGLGEQPVIQRWVLDDNDGLELDEQLSLANYGLIDALGGGRNVMQFLSEDRAYFIDGQNLQVVVWDPNAMEPIDLFSIDGLDEPGHTMATNYVHRDGDRLVMTARYWRPDDTAAELVKAVIIDTDDDSVSYIEDHRCGSIAFQATDSNGHLYLASHPAHVTALAAGVAGDPPAESCLLRIQAGADEFDADYYVDLNELSDGYTGGIMQGSGDNAYVLTYAGETPTLDNYVRLARGGNWEIHSIVLGNEQATYERVPELELFSGYGLAFRTRVDGEDVPFIIAVEGDLSAGAYYDVSDPTDFKAALKFQGFPGHAVRVR